MKSLRSFGSAFLLVVLLSAFGMAQSFNCDSAVNDLAGVLGGRLGAVSAAAASLSSQGADPRIVTFSSLNGTIDDTVMGLVKQCRSMQGPKGGPKTNLVVIAVAPNARKYGIWAGIGYEAAFGMDRMGRYKRDFMIPSLKTADWPSAMILPANQMAERLKAYNSEANAPVSNTTTNVNNSQPTDFRGLWIFLWILGGIGVAAFVFFLIRARKVAAEQAEQAQQNAIGSRNEAADLISELQLSLAAFADKTKPGYVAADNIFGIASSAYSRLAGSLSGDPTSPDLGKGTYESLADQYVAIVDMLHSAKNYLANPETDPYAPRVVSNDDVDENPIVASRRRHSRGSNSRIQTQPSTVVVHDNGPGFIEGAILGSVLSNRSDREEREHYSEPEAPSAPASEPEPEETFSSSSSSSSFDDDSSSSSSFSDSSSSDSFSSSSDSFSSGSGSDSF